MSKLIEQLKFTLSIVGLLMVFIGNRAQAQTVADGAMDVEIWCGYSYVESTDGGLLGGCDGIGVGLNNCEFRWRWKVRDAGNLDGQGFVPNPGVLYAVNTTSYGWVEPTDRLLFSHFYGTPGSTPQNVPQFMQLEGNGWEDDCWSCAGGFICLGNCSNQTYSQNVNDGGCSSCGCDCSGEDNNCGPTTGFNDIDFRIVPPCAQIVTIGPSWVGDFFTSSCGDDDIGAEILARWTPPIPGSITANSPQLCDPGFVTLTAGGAVHGGDYAWYNNGTGTFLGTGSAINVFVAATTTYRVHSTNDTCESRSYLLLTIEISDLQASNVSTNNPDCAGASTGSITITAQGGQPPYTYSVDNGGNFSASSTISNLPAGSYTIKVRDANGCEVSYLGNPVLLIDPVGALISLATATDADCFGASTGSILYTITGGIGPFQYSVNNGVSYSASNPVTGLAAGLYNIMLMDGNGCEVPYLNNPVEIQQPPQISVTSIQTTDVLCNGDSSGSITVFANGGTGALSISVDGGANYQSGNTFSGLTAGSYNVFIQDAAGCVEPYGFNPVVINEPTAVTATATSNPASCIGNFDGSISVTAGGGTPPYLYSVNGSPFQPGGNFAGLGPGSYTVLVSDANGCTGTASTSIGTVYTVNVIIFNKIDVSCNGLNNGSFIVLPTGGIGPYTYSIDGINYFADSLFSGLSAGTYTVITLDAGGCTNNQSVTINEPSQLVSSLASVSNAPCFGGAGGSITVSVSGGTPTYTYLWSNGMTDANITGLGGGNFTLTITDVSNCTVTVSATINQPPQIFSNIASTTDVSCNGGNDGSIDISVTGGTPPYTYLWADGNTNEDRNFLSAGSYSFVATDQNACTISDTVVITEPNALSVSSTTQDVDCAGNGNGSVNLVVTGGTSPYNYLWNNFTTTQNNVGLSGGSYSVVITDANGCTVSESAVVNEPAPLSSVGTTTDVLCLGDSNGTASVVVSGGTAPYQYVWPNGDINSATSGLSIGIYVVSITDANGCVLTDSLLVSGPSGLQLQITVSDVLCFGDSNGMVDLFVGGGTPIYTYIWSNGETDEDLTGLGPATYAVTVTDANGCVNIDSANVSEPPALTSAVLVSQITCNGGNDGIIDLAVNGGTAPYTFVWSNFSTDEDIQNLTAGVYNVIITDVNGCVATESTTLTDPPLLGFTVAITDVVCNGELTGAVDLTITGGVAPYGFSWSNSDVTEDLTNVAAGLYTVTVTDANACQLIATAEIAEPPLLSVSVAGTDIACAGDADGFAIATVVGGTPGNPNPYTYIWNSNPPQTDFVASNLAAGNYTLVVTDANGCQASDSVEISEPDPINLVLEFAPVTCFGGADAIVGIHATGGVGPFTYSMNGITYQSDSLFTNLGAGTYGIAVQDQSGCEASAGFSITEPPPFYVNIEPNDIIVGVFDEDQFFVNVSPDSAVYTYVWNPADELSCDNCPDPVFTATGNPGIRELVVTVIDENDCAFQDTLRIRVSDEIGIWVPNAFSPNGDGVNDYLQVFDIGAKTIDFRIFNRWGAEVYHNDQMKDDQGWDGTYKGKDGGTATYVWMAEVEYFNGENRKETGSFSIIK